MAMGQTSGGGKSVRDVMSPKVATVSSVTFLPEAAKVMLKEDIGMLPVVDDGKLKGILTDRDITVRCVAESKDVTQTKVGDCLSTGNLVTVSPDTDIQQAGKLMQEHQVRRLPVVEADTVVGVVSLADIAREVSPQQGAQVLNKVTQPGGEHTQS